MNYYQRRRKAFGYAITGLLRFFGEEDHARLHASAAIMTIALGFWLEISTLEWIAVTLCIGMVLTAEAFNSAIEHLVDLVSPDHHQLAGRVKDLAAGAVLLAAVAAFVIGIIIFIPKIVAHF